MTTENHLTVRDYFDQALVGRTMNGKAYSSHRASKSGNRTFHQILTSQGDRQSDHNNANPTGLTVVDYMKHPIRVKSHYNRRAVPQDSDMNTTKPDQTASVSTGMQTKESAAAPGVRSRAQRKPMRLTGPTASTASPDQASTNETLAIEKSIRKAARKYDLPSNLLRGVIRAESNFQVKAVSHAGARGLMQLMPQTAKELGVDNPFNIEQNIDGGARYLRKMLDNFGGDLKVALAAYNAGPGAVEKYGGQIPPYQETEQYIKRVLRFSKQMA